MFIEDERATMNLFTAKGEKVKYLDENGYDGDREHANRYLLKNNTYTVETVQIYSWSSTVVLSEFPNKHFNPIMFANIGEVKICSDEEKKKRNTYLSFRE